MRNAGTRGVETDFLHCFIEALTIFRFINGIGGSADHGDAEFSQHALAFQLQRTVERGLTAHRRQYRIRALFFYDFAHHFPVDRLDVGGIGHFRVGHNGCRVGVDQDDAVTLFAQRLTRLRTRVVKFTGLANNNRASTKDQDIFMSVRFGISSLLIIWQSNGKRQSVR